MQGAQLDLEAEQCHQHSPIMFNHGVSCIYVHLVYRITVSLTSCALSHVHVSFASTEIGPPPDLPSLLLNNRIIYIGMPLVPSVTELVIAQLLYLNYQNENMITMYINSPGTNSPDGKAFSFDTEAFAIADTMQFIRPPIRTICVGQAFGTAAMILSLGQKGNRMALPNASIMLNQPRSRARGQASDVAIKAKEIINNRKVTNEWLAKACGKDLAMIEKDTSRVRYLSGEEAIEYGLIDKVLYPEDLRVSAPKFIDFL